MDPVHTANMAKTAAETAATAARAAQMVQQAQTLVAYAGDPKAAIKNLSDLERLNNSVKRLTGVDSGVGSMVESGRNLQRANQELTNARRSIEVMGQKRTSDPSLFEALDAAEALAAGVKQEIKIQQAARQESAEKLADAQKKLSGATTEAEIQAASAQIQALAAQQIIANGQLQQQALQMQIEKESAARAAEEKAIVEQAQRDATAQAARKRDAEQNASANRKAMERRSVDPDKAKYDYSVFYGGGSTP
jgi:hypothetical protein